MNFHSHDGACLSFNQTLKSNISQQEQWRTNNSAVKMVELVNELMKRFDKNIKKKKRPIFHQHIPISVVMRVGDA